MTAIAIVAIQIADLIALILHILIRLDQDQDLTQIKKVIKNHIKDHHIKTINIKMINIVKIIKEITKKIIRDHLIRMIIIRKMIIKRIINISKLYFINFNL